MPGFILAFPTLNSFILVNQSFKNSSFLSFYKGWNFFNGETCILNKEKVIVQEIKKVQKIV
jgi:hypothetical protein